MTIDLELIAPVNQSRKVSRAEYERTGLYAHLYHQLATYVDDRGNQVREMDAVEMARWMIAAEVGTQDKQLAVFLRSLMFHLGAWAKMRVEQAKLLKGWQLRSVQELFDYTPAGMDIPPPVFYGEQVLYDKRGFFMDSERVDREKLKTFCLTGDARSVKTTIGFNPMNVHAAKLAVVILHMEVHYQTKTVIKRQKGEGYTEWFHRLTEQMAGKVVRKDRDKTSALPRKSIRK